MTTKWLFFVNIFFSIRCVYANWLIVGGFYIEFENTITPRDDFHVFFFFFDFIHAKPREDGEFTMTMNIFFFFYEITFSLKGGSTPYFYKENEPVEC